MTETKHYWPVDGQTKEVKQAVLASYRGGIFHIPRNALKVKPLPHKKGFAVVAIMDEYDKPIDTEYLEDHRGATIYDESNCNKVEVVSELGEIKEGFTLEEPSSVFDKRENGVWVTDLVDKYHHEYRIVNSIRESLYTEKTDPLVNEVKKLEILEAEVNKAEIDLLKSRIKELNTKIKEENPWPEKPEGVL